MSSLKKNMVYQIGYEVLSFILPLITSPYISRVLGAEKIGIYSYSYSVAYYFHLFAMLGIKYYGTREIAASRESIKERNEKFTSVFLLHLFLTVVMSILYGLYCAFYTRENRTIALIQGLFVLSAVLDINWLFFGLEKFKITVSRNIVIKICTACAVFLFVRENGDLWKYTLIMALGNFASQLVVWMFAFRYVKFVKVKWADILVHIKPMFMLFVPIIAVTILKYLSEILLGIFSTHEEVGLYDNAYKIITMPSALIVAVGTVMLPKMSNLIKNNMGEKGEKYIEISYRYLMCLAIGMSFGLMAVADEFSVIFWGEEFAKCGTLIKILSVAIPFTAYANITRTQYLMPNNKDKIYMHSTIVAMLINVLFNILLVTEYQSVGVAWVTVLSELVIMIYQIFAIQKEADQKRYIKSFVFFYALGGGMLVFLDKLFIKLNYSLGSLVLKIVVGIVIYGIFSMIYLLIVRDEYAIRLFKSGRKNK